MIKLIVAHDLNGLIGAGDVMPWHIKEELAFFRQETLNHSLLMGRKTFEGIGKVLPNRTTYILTSDLNYQVADENVVVINDTNDLFKKFENNAEILFIAGGKTVYEQFYQEADELIISVINEKYDGDVYFVDINFNNYHIIEQKVHSLFTTFRYCKNFV